MKRALGFAIAFLLSSTALQAQARDPLAPIRSYAARVLPKCPGGVLTLEPVPDMGPKNFQAFTVTVRSTDQYCGTQKYLLYSPTSGQVLMGVVLELPASGKPVNVRIAEETSKRLNKQMTATVAPFPLPDGIKAVTINRPTPYGTFAFNGFIDGSERFLIVGGRGSIKSDATQQIKDAIGFGTAPRRGKSDSKVEIIELSDFQCPTCAHAHEKVEPIIQANLGKISYTRIDLPLFEHHEWAIPAAAAARAIQKVAPTKYWTYVDYVFKNQEHINKLQFDKVIQEFAEDNDIDWNALKAIYASKAERQAILDQISRIYAIGIVSTPTFIVNGQMMGFGPEGTFTIDAIKKAIGSAPAAAKKPAK